MKKYLQKILWIQGVQRCMSKRGYKAFYCLVLIGFILNGCKKDDHNNGSTIMDSRNDKTLYERLLSAGFHKENIKDVGDAYLVEGDMLFGKNKVDYEFFDKYFKSTKSESTKNGNKIQQWSTQNVISIDNAERIKVNVQAHHYAVDQALTNWSNIPNSTLSFYAFKGLFTNDNRIEILNGYAYGAYAVAKFPENGQAGFQIIVDNNIFSPLSNAQQIFIMAHEIGHCLGFRHTDNPGYDSFGTVQVPGTPTSDAQSVMNSGAAYSGVPSWSQFSNYDKIATQYLYSTTTSSGIITSPAIKYPNIMLQLPDYGLNYTIQWNPNKINSSTVKLELYQFGQLKTVIATNANNSGQFEFPITNYLVQDSNDHYTSEVQIKIIDNNNPLNYDFTPLFYIYVD